jgi:hypothetical protein
MHPNNLPTVYGKTQNLYGPVVFQADRFACLFFLTEIVYQKIRALCASFIFLFSEDRTLNRLL